LGNLFDGIAGFGLGGSTVALFGRVGGGIYTKAADVGADLVGKVAHELDEDSPRNPATIADNVGDNVGDVAGMGADLFGSFAESTCAALVVSSSTLIVAGQGASVNFLFFPLSITAVGIVISFVTSIHGGFYKEVIYPNEIEGTLKQQLLFSSVLLTPAILGAAYWTMPE
jgi:Na+/H+-translocating membrane pyrophosphatase